MQKVENADVTGKRVLVRVDFNVPLKDGKVADDSRIRAALPTLELLHHNGAAKIILLTHLGEPKGVEESLRVAPVAQRLMELTQVPCELRENLRFDPREEQNDPVFARELAALGDVYVNEAFSDSHRAHASIVSLPKHLPSFIGLRFAEEIVGVTPALTPPKGALAIIGGAKFETKEPLLQKLILQYEKVLLGGALGNDLLKARGHPFGESLVAPTPMPPELSESDRLVAPADVVVRESGASAERTSAVNDIRAHERVVDIGPKTAEAWSKEIAAATFVIWNGPMGVYEQSYADGTDALARALAAAVCRAVVGGGDTEAALSKFEFDKSRIFVSMGGGAMLEFLTHGTLVGLEALEHSPIA